MSVLLSALLLLLLLLTWFEQHHGLETGELGGVDCKGLVATEGLLQEAQVQASVGVLALHTGAKVGQRQQRAAVQRQGPLDGAQQEELTPRLLQQDDLVDGGSRWHFNKGLELLAYVLVLLRLQTPQHAAAILRTVCSLRKIMLLSLHRLKSLFFYFTYCLQFLFTFYLPFILNRFMNLKHSFTCMQYEVIYSPI